MPRKKASKIENHRIVKLPGAATTGIKRCRRRMRPRRSSGRRRTTPPRRSTRPGRTRRRPRPKPKATKKQTETGDCERQAGARSRSGCRVRTSRDTIHQAAGPRESFAVRPHAWRSQPRVGIMQDDEGDRSTGLENHLDLTDPPSAPSNRCERSRAVVSLAQNPCELCEATTPQPLAAPLPIAESATVTEFHFCEYCELCECRGDVQPSVSSSFSDERHHPFGECLRGN